MVTVFSVYKDKKVLVTGHTGFKGTWLCLWLELLGAKVVGYSNAIPTQPSLFKLTAPKVKTIWGDVRDVKKLKKVIQKEKPDIVFHLAAQPLVRASYQFPVETFETNVMGTANVLDSLRGSSVKAAVIITTDKVYENNETGKAFKESDPLGGHDPYSASKGAAEIVVASYRNSFFNNKEYGKKHHTLIAAVRAGNVIGGGDFAVDRLMPDFIRAILAEKPLAIRNPQAIRPWQHVLEPLSGYLLLGERLLAGKSQYAEAWNFGPEEADAKTVAWIVKKMCSKWAQGATYVVTKGPHPHEAHYLKLDIAKAKKKLKWQPLWDLETALDKIIVWTKAYALKGNMRTICFQQIKEYSEGKR
jgi:CDP-glucose 4,6-dehydratase